MDTRFWGPSGWRLLHLAVATPKQERELVAVNKNFEELPYVLPCKFCRYSLSGYYEQHPIPESFPKYERWLYEIHNEVNGKLRSQNILNQPNPTYEDIHKRYAAWASAPCASSQMLGWDFLYSIANTTPSKTSHSAPMDNASPNITSDHERNKYNILTYKERLPHIQRWWDSFGEVLPFAPWRSAWKRGTTKFGKAPVKKGKKAVLAWLYKMEQFVCATMAEEAPHNSFEGLCKEVSAFSSGCGKKTSSRVITCRAKKISVREKLRRTRRAKFHTAGGVL